MASQSLKDVLASASVDLSPYETLYKHFHTHPELSHQEKITSETAISHLSKLNEYELHTHIGGYGFAGVLRNGSEKTILLRADMDGLPVKELTGLPYASTVTVPDKELGTNRPVMHACGHDMHMTCLLAAAEILAKSKDAWSGTLIVLFQPAEERGEGARAMVDDGLYSKIPVPDYAFGQHVVPLPAGKVVSKAGSIMTAADSFKITLYGRGGHGSMPHQTVDPVVLASNVVQRLQTIVSREIMPGDVAVVTVGSIQAGSAENIIADSAELGVDIRSTTQENRDKIISSIHRIVEAECAASNSPKAPVIRQSRRFPLTANDEGVTETLSSAFHGHFGDSFENTHIWMASEDFSILASSHGRPYSFWLFGGADPEVWAKAEKKGTLLQDIAGNHSAYFAPVIQPTLRAGVDALCLAALTFMKPS